MVKIKNMKAGEFESRFLEKRESVVCFCAGYGLLELCEVYPMLTERIKYVVDNYSHGRNLLIGSREVPVISLDEVRDEIKESLVVITSLKFADEIIRQLDGIELCCGLEVFVPALFQADGGYVELKRNKTFLIPKRIHYCWFGHGSIPEQFQKNIESWKRVCPDYEIVRWDETNYDYRKNKYMRQAYEVGKWGFVPDYARLDVINTYGGIYLDTDIELLKPLDDLLQYPLFCGFEDAWSVNFGLGFGGTADHPLLQEMMGIYNETDFVRSDKTLNLTASPAYQTKVLVGHGLARNGSCQMWKEVAVFSPEFFSPINVYGYGRVTENTYSIHQYAGTWFGEEQKSSKSRTLRSAEYVMKRMNSGT